MKILKFGATWCKECTVMKPMFAEIEQEIPELRTEFYEADDSKEVMEKYNIESIPTFIFLDKNDQEFLRLTGLQNKEELVKIIKENLDK
jgi:thioredoxin 1